MRISPLLILLLAMAPPASADDSQVRANYLLACRGCHLADGNGVPPNVPSLRNTLGQFTTTEAGRGYLVRVPGVLQSRLNDRQLAEVINWVLTEFNAETLPQDFRHFTETEVAGWRKQILADPASMRARLLAELSLE
jgi:mono/diheme cytochrome c family protein